MQRGRQRDHRGTSAKENAAERGAKTQGKVVFGDLSHSVSVKLAVSRRVQRIAANPFICCLAVVVMDQILDLSLWINIDVFWGESSEGV